MAKVGSADLLSRYRKVDFDGLKFLSSQQSLKNLFSKASIQPQNTKPAEIDPNSIYIDPSQKKKKILSHPIKGGEQVHVDNENHQQRQKNYRPGPFAMFYEINEGQLNKQAEVWYYKDHKDIVGPVSSYNMDKMVFFRTITEDTKVAFKAIDKFVKFKKIKTIVEEEQQKQEQ